MLTVRFLLGYLAFCAALSAFQVHGITSAACYLLGLLACVLVAPVERWIGARRQYRRELARFAQDVQVARRRALQIYRNSR